MTKQFFLTALCAMALCPALAQTTQVEERVEYSTDKYKVETNRFWHNWFVSLGAGGQIYFGDHDKQCSLGDRIAPAVDLMVGKWFTPGIGVRLGYSGLQQRGATQKGPNLVHSTGVDVPGKGGNGYWLEKQKFNMGNLHVDVMFNVLNLFGGYNEGRKWDLSPYGGVGFAWVYDSPAAHEVSANVGLLTSWHFCKALALTLDVHGMFVNDRFDGEGGGRFGEGNLSATLGLTYKFKGRGWERSKTVYHYERVDIEEMNRRIQAISEENERMKAELAKGNTQTAQTIVKKVAAGNLVTFKINKSKLSNEARANLGLLAEVIKQGDPDAVYTITGYADAGTGNTTINQRLSQERADAVYRCLTEEFGVDPAQLRIDYKGGVENMFYNDPRLSRAVITRTE